VHAVDQDVHVMRAVPFTELLARPLARPRFAAWLVGVFGTSALLLAAIGLYAVMAAYVRQRSKEIGVRVALGATASNLRGLVLGEGLRLAVVGATLGLAGAIALAPLLRGLLYEVLPLDPATLLAATTLLIGVSVVACYLPARRATRVDPIAALRAL
jgi:putative ABC transport system permease protein